MVRLDIRTCRPGDHEAVWRLHNTALTETGAHLGNGPWDDDLKAIERTYLEAGGAFLVGETDNEIVAMGALKRVDVQTGEIKRMRVAPILQRRGFGRLVLQTLEDTARIAGLTRVVLDTTTAQPQAQDFYEAHGYRETRREERHGQTLVFYQKNLAEPR